MDSQPVSQPLLTARSMRKAFAGVPVLEGVDIDLYPGEIHTVMGENGAGKSTLMKIIAGVHRADGGTITLGGQVVDFGSPQAALRAGVTLIHQEPLSFPDLTVAENILMSRGLPKAFPNRIAWSEMFARSHDLLGQLGVSLDPRRPMAGLSVADQQMVELAAALANDARLLLMDEPTAALTPGEVDRLFAIVDRLRKQGVAIVFVSHRLPEVFSVSDRITVLRDGKFIATKKVSETTTEEIVRLMVGRELGALFQKQSVPQGRTLLEVNGITREGTQTPVSFTVRAGEIVGLAGLVGAGRTELAETLFGLRKKLTGSIAIEGQRVEIGSPKQALAHGLAYVPEDRARNGLLLPMPIEQNMSLAALTEVSRWGLLAKIKEKTLGESWRTKLAIRMRDGQQPVRELSGGNQQKVVLAKWLTTRPRVLIIDEPTRGVDIGAKSEVHHHLVELARQGTAIVMISSDLPEVLAMSDRILVMRGNALVAELPGGTSTTQEQVMAAATGIGSFSESPSTFTNSSTAKTPHLVFLTRFPETSVILFILLTASICAAVEPNLRKPETLHAVLMYLPIMLVVAVGQLPIIITRNIDLSVGSTVGLAAIVSCNLFVSFPNASPWLAALIALAVGAVAGLVNGLLVGLFRVPAIVATLGTYTAYRGLTYLYSGGRQVDAYQLPESLRQLAQEGPLGVPWIVWLSLGVAGALHIVFRHTLFGRHIYALGSNPEAARLRGVKTRQVTVSLFVLIGTLSGLAGILWASRYGTINPKSAGEGLELMVISAVVIGGAAVSGGAGSVVGTLLGCLLLAIVNIAIITLRVSPHWQIAVYGLAILVACLLNGLLRRPAGGLSR